MSLFCHSLALTGILTHLIRIKLCSGSILLQLLSSSNRFVRRLIHRSFHVKLIMNRILKSRLTELCGGLGALLVMLFLLERRLSIVLLHRLKRLLICALLSGFAGNRENICTTVVDRA